MFDVILRTLSRESNGVKYNLNIPLHHMDTDNIIEMNHPRYIDARIVMDVFVLKKKVRLTNED